MHEHPSNTINPKATELFNSAMQFLRESPLRVTSPRISILRLLSREHGPFTAEQTHEHVKEYGCDLVTVYRTLTTFEELGLVRRCDFGDGAYRYEINDPDHHHHHLVCRKCRKVETMEICVITPLEELASEKGYTNLTHSLEVFGVCPECSQAKK